jgi:hypothetical protein
LSRVFSFIRHAVGVLLSGSFTPVDETANRHKGRAALQREIPLSKNGTIPDMISSIRADPLQSSMVTNGGDDAVRAL